MNDTMTPRLTKKYLRSLAYLDAGTCVLTSAFDGVLDRLELEGKTITDEQALWLHNLIGDIADKLTSRGLRR